MNHFLSRLSTLLSELKRRKIFRAAVVYAAVAFVVLQVADIIFPALNLPGWALTLLVVVAILGFPLVLALEWVYEITSEGVRPEPTTAQETLETAGASEARPAVGASAAGPPDAGTVPAGGSLWRRPLLLVPAAVVLLFALAAGWGLWRSQSDPEPALSATAVAVLPFSVRGDEDARYLGEGIVNLLGTALDGAGALRAVDARALFGTLAQEGGGTPDLERGRRLAVRLGAGLFVLGDIVQAGERFHVEAAVYDATGGTEPRTRAAVSGRDDGLFELVDELAARLVAGLSDAPGDRLTRTAAVTTTSFPAFKAYLDGEAHVRAGRFERAVEAYLQAIAHDSTFAIAYYRLALTRDGAALAGRVEAAQDAVRHAGRLSSRDRALLEALQAYHRGDAPDAERRYRAILARYPDDLEAWFQLAEVLFHYGPLRGRSIAESEEAWRKVLSYEPRNLWALVHLARVAAAAGRTGTLDSLLTRFAPAEMLGDRRLVQAGVIRAIAARDTVMAATLVREARNWEDAAVWQLATYVTAFTYDPPAARRVIQGLLEAHRGRGVLAELHWYVALLHLAGGRWAEARNARAEALAAGTASANHRVFDPVSEWWLAMLPLPYPDSTLERIRGTAISLAPARWEVESRFEPETALPERIWSEILGEGRRLEALRQYAVGTLSLRLADPRSAAAAAEVLARVAGAEGADAFVRDLDRGLRARIAWHENRPAHGLRLLEELEHGPGTRAGAVGAVTVVPFVARAHERYLRGELLAALGRHSEALPWFASLGELSMPESPFRAPAHLRQAEIHERLGNRAEAARYYARFIELWQDCDPEFRPLVERARQRLAELRSGRE